MKKLERKKEIVDILIHIFNEYLEDYFEDDNANKHIASIKLYDVLLNDCLLVARALNISTNELKDIQELLKVYIDENIERISLMKEKIKSDGLK